MTSGPRLKLLIGGLGRYAGRAIGPRLLAARGRYRTGRGKPRPVPGDRIYLASGRSADIGPVAASAVSGPVPASVAAALCGADTAVVGGTGGTVSERSGRPASR